MHIEQLPSRFDECPLWWRNVVRLVTKGEDRGALDDELAEVLGPYEAVVHNLDSREPFVEFQDEALALMLKLKYS